LPLPTSPLQQAVHRHRAFHIPADLLHRLLLGGGQRKGKQAADAGVDPRRDRQTRSPALLDPLLFAECQGQLQDEKFLVHEPPSRLILLGRIVRGVDLPQGRRDVQQPVCLAIRGREDFFHAGGVGGYGGMHHLLHLRLAEAFGQWIDRLRPFGRERPVAVPGVDAGMRELPAASLESRGPAEPHAGAAAKSLPHERLVEPDRPHVVAIQANQHAQQISPGPRVLQLDLLDHAQQAGGSTFLQFVDRANDEGFRCRIGGSSTADRRRSESRFGSVIPHVVARRL
jgi:hypothetical protein